MVFIPACFDFVWKVPLWRIPQIVFEIHSIVEPQTPINLSDITLMGHLFFPVQLSSLVNIWTILFQECFRTVPFNQQPNIKRRFWHLAWMSRHAPVIANRFENKRSLRLYFFSIKNKNRLNAVWHRKHVVKSVEWNQVRSTHPLPPCLGTGWSKILSLRLQIFLPQQVSFPPWQTSLNFCCFLFCSILAVTDERREISFDC